MSILVDATLVAEKRAAEAVARAAAAEKRERTMQHWNKAGVILALIAAVASIVAIWLAV